MENESKNLKFNTFTDYYVELENCDDFSCIQILGKMNALNKNGKLDKWSDSEVINIMKRKHKDLLKKLFVDDMSDKKVNELCDGLYEQTISQAVNNPKHYGGKDNPYECIKVLKNWLSKEEYEGFLKGNTLKYLCRVGKKDDEVQELKKAKWYLEKLIESKEYE